MNELLTTAQSVLDTLLKMPTILLFALALNAVGWCLKRCPFPNRFIPLTVIALSAVGMPFVLARTPCGEMSPYLSSPETADLVRRVSVGLIVGLCSWGSHKLILSKLEKILPGLAGGDTEVIKKP